MNDLALYENILPLEKNFPIKFRYAVEKEYYPLHWHEHLELLYFRAGECRVVCGGESYLAKKKELIIINRNELHSTENDGTGRFFCIRITPSFFSDVDCENTLFHSFIKGDEFITNCFEQIFMEHQAKSEGYDMQIKSLVYALMAHIVRHYKTDSLSGDEILIRKNKTKRISDILTYISANYHTKLTTNALAERFHLTDHYFCCFFKNETGQSPIDYINRYRIEKSTILLKNSDQSITNIAQKVGFDDSNYFSRIFKRYIGITPREYRK
ncbi:MAG: AraC family transcriptional regulator [Ruminococcaceae bacterium]|nr:AraC family transcriptional regulator [Oscillospiraceae bacterium]